MEFQQNFTKQNILLNAQGVFSTNHDKKIKFIAKNSVKEGDFNSAVKNYQINIMIDEAGYKEISVDGKLRKYQEGILIKSDFEVLELV